MSGIWIKTEKNITYVTHLSVHLFCKKYIVDAGIGENMIIIAQFESQNHAISLLNFISKMIENKKDFIEIKNMHDWLEGAE